MGLAAFHHTNLNLGQDHFAEMESYDLHSEYDIGYTGRRKGRKLLAEKRRRARINQCLNQIKDVVCGVRKGNDPNYEKIEKAEILESTVDYLRNVRKINTTHQQVKETVQARFHQGFSRCAEEFLTYIQSLPGVSDNVQHQLRKHLSGRVTQIREVTMTSTQQPVTSHTNQWYDRLGPLPSPFPHPSAHVYMNSPVCTSPVRRDNNLEDSGYVGSPNSLTFPYEHNEQRHPENASDSELCNVHSRKPSHRDDNSRVRAWVHSTLPYSRQVKIEQQAPWRPW